MTKRQGEVEGDCRDLGRETGKTIETKRLGKATGAHL